MRKTLNRKLIEKHRQSPGDGSQRDLEWEAFLHLHIRAQDLGILGKDEELHQLLDARLAVFEVGGRWEVKS